MAVCRNCRCAKSKSPCVSCYPARKNMCQNTASGSPSTSCDRLEVSQNRASRASDEPSNSRLTTNMKHPQGLSDDFESFQRGSVLDRIPKAARHAAAAALNLIMKGACQSDSEDDWRKLFRFSSLCFKKPKRGGKKQPSLAITIKRQINEYLADPLQPIITPQTPHSRKKKSPKENDALSKLVAKKLANDDTKGAIRILSSEDTILPFDDDTLSRLKSKHPPLHPETDFPSPPDENEISTALQLSESQVLKAIQSFPGGSAGGSDLLLPQHLKDLTSKICGEPGLQLLKTITLLCNKMLRAEIPRTISPFLYGASLIAFSKPGGGIRPIAIGNTLRRLTAKAAAFAAKEAVRAKLFPTQLGVAVPGGAAVSYTHLTLPTILLV